MPDYRNRPPVDLPPPTIGDTVKALNWWEFCKLALIIVSGAASGALCAVAGGYLWR